MDAVAIPLLCKVWELQREGVIKKWCIVTRTLLSAETRRDEGTADRSVRVTPYGDVDGKF